MRETSYCYTVQAFQAMTPDGLTISDMATVEVFANSEDEAINKAMSLVEKNQYRVSKVVEFYYDHRIDGYTNCCKKDE